MKFYNHYVKYMDIDMMIVGVLWIDVDFAPDWFQNTARGEIIDPIICSLSRQPPQQPKNSPPKKKKNNKESNANQTTNEPTNINLDLDTRITITD